MTFSGRARLLLTIEVGRVGVWKMEGMLSALFIFCVFYFILFFFILYMIFSTTLHLSCEWHSTKQKGFVYMEPTWNIHQNEWKEILHLTCFTATSPCFPTMCVVVSHVIIAFWFPFFICTEKSTSLNELSMKWKIMKCVWLSWKLI